MSSKSKCKIEHTSPTDLAMDKLNEERIKREKLSLQRKRLRGACSGGPPYKRKGYIEYLKKDIKRLEAEVLSAEEKSRDKVQGEGV